MLLVEAEGYDAKLRAALRQWEEFKSTQEQVLGQLLKDYHDQYLAAFAGVTEWDARRYQEVKEQIEAARRRYDSQVDLASGDALQGSVAQALFLHDDPLKAIGVPVDTVPAVVPERQLSLLSNVLPEQIKGIGLEVQRDVQGLLQQALLGGLDTRSIIERMGDVVPGLSKKPRGKYDIWTSAHIRSRNILRTEMNRAHNITHTARNKELHEKYPGVGRKWLHRRSNNPRPSHARLDGKIVYGDEKFSVNGVEADGPHDPVLPAADVINCHCGVVSVYDSDKKKDEPRDPLVPKTEEPDEKVKAGVPKDKKAGRPGVDRPYTVDDPFEKPPEFKTKKEAKQWFKTHMERPGGFGHVDVSGCSPFQAQVFGDALADVCNTEYFKTLPPRGKKKIRHAGITTPPHKVKGGAPSLNVSADQWTTGQPFDRRTMRVYRDVALDEDDFAFGGVEAHADLRAIITHELGHAIDGHFMDSEWFPGYKNYIGGYQPYRGLESHMPSSRIMQAIKDSGYPAHKLFVSNYAHTNKREWFAEAVAYAYSPGSTQSGRYFSAHVSRKEMRRLLRKGMEDAVKDKRFRLPLGDDPPDLDEDYYDSF